MCGRTIGPESGELDFVHTAEEQPKTTSSSRKGSGNGIEAWQSNRRRHDFAMATRLNLAMGQG
jgi:hypothetical protein